MLPVFPPLALVLGHYLAPVWRNPSARGLRAGFIGFSAIAGLLGVGLMGLFFKPALLGATVNADEIGHFAMLSGVFLLGGAVGVYLLQRSENPRIALHLMLVSTGAFAAVLVVATPAIARPSTKELARFVAQQAGPADIVLHYHDYFHDFSYYSGRTVGTVGYEGELELFLDPEAARRGLHVSEQEFLELWAGPRRIYLLLRRSEMIALQAQPGFHSRILAETHKHVLLINQP